MPAAKPTLKLLSARLGRWPRRIAALACLVLAAGSALVPQSPTAATARAGIAARLNGAEVAVPLPISVLPPDLVRPGDHVGVLAAADDATSPASLVADGLRVLSLRTDTAAMTSDSATVVVVAAQRAEVVRLARFSTGRLVLFVDRLP